MFRNAIARTQARVSLAHAQRRGLACVSLYVKGLPVQTADDELRSMFERFGPIYNTRVLPASPIDRYTVGFVKFYAGELPDTVEKLAELPYPSQEEIETAKGCADEAISAFDGSQMHGVTLKVSPTVKDMPDNIQFRARLQIRRDQDPEFAKNAPARERKSDSTPTYSGGYKDGYKDGYRDGAAAASRESQN
ncbi:hypothetical protein H4S02_012413 [Coemansia sp. RSA 2611]|nr:hypothetical protein LPJ70_000464 [Coemansia sp. RSA 2708]KAJ2356566.1 hypothetical protein H4S01_006673 [Coemansia sp. RSA 2610]KAJ2358145.1 hypothetical protein H4S02_012413 [Coemansia sp. RSA 2611]